jgi:hypothetical protein
VLTEKSWSRVPTAKSSLCRNVQAARPAATQRQGRYLQRATTQDPVHQPAVSAIENRAADTFETGSDGVLSPWRYLNHQVSGENESARCAPRGGFLPGNL